MGHPVKVIYAPSYPAWVYTIYYKNGGVGTYQPEFGLLEIIE
jgi:hypothetical protein